MIAGVLDKVKTLGFKYATEGGITISKNDIVVPEDKQEILALYEKQVERVEEQYERGLITEEERHEKIVEIWTEATDEVAEAMQRNLKTLNPIYMMANSGARGSFKQIRQLAGMRGLMANPKGEIIERPIQANFMEGLSVLEYFISTHGARKGLADTALRTADSGYLTRRLVDVAQDVIIRDDNCKTKDFIDLPVLSPDGLNKSALGRVLGEDLMKPLASGKPGKTKLASKGDIVTAPLLQEIADELAEQAAETTLPVRSVLKCRSDYGVCRDCYGIFLATGELAEIGDAVGIIAAQSIGEPGTQLTMRTFHTGGVAGADITHGLPRVVEIFEARNPKGAAKLAEVAGLVDIEQTDRGVKVTIVPDEKGKDGEELAEVSYALPRRTRLLVKKGDHVEPGRPAQRRLSCSGRAARPALEGRQGRDSHRAVSRLRGAPGLPLTGRGDPRQAHRADRPPDDEEGEGARGRATPSFCPASSWTRSCSRRRTCGSRRRRASRRRTSR